MPGNQTEITLLQGLPLFYGLDQATLLKLAGTLTPRRLPEGTLIFALGDPGEALFVIKEGQVRIFQPGEDGREKTLAILGPGEAFGEMALLDGQPRSASAETIAPSLVLTLYRKDFLPLLEHPVFARRVITILATRLRETNRQVEFLVSSAARNRVLKALFSLQDSFHKDGPAYPVTIPLSHQELAEWCGLNRETVTRTLGELEEEGVLKTARRKIILLKPVRER